MTQTNVYKWDPETEDYERVAEWHDDGTVVGSGEMATRLRTAVDEIEEAGENPADYYIDIRDRLRGNWDNGFYRVEWE